MKKQITKHQFDQLTNKMLIDYISNATPVLWHQMAMDWNYDNENIFFNWLINNNQTDRATALMIYWMSAPQFAKQYNNREEVLQKEQWYVDDFDFIEQLESKLLNGYFVNSNFAYDPKNEHTGTDWTRAHTDIKMVRKIPAVLYEPLNGDLIPVPTNFIEGFPPDIIDRWSILDEEYEIVY